MERSQYIAANLRLARLFHGFSLEAIAEAIGKTRQYVYKLETEQIEPTADVLSSIAEKTQVKPEFFLRPIPSPVSEEHCHFRKQFSARAAVKHTAVAKGEMFRRIAAWLDSEVVMPEIRLPQIEAGTPAQIEQAAEACRREWGLGLGPIQNMTRLTELVGVLVTNFRQVSREVDAFSVSASRPVAVLNTEDSSPCRVRFDLAHELGHLVMHVGQNTGDRRTESEANRFAGALLLPRASFVREFPRLRGRHLNWAGLVEMKMRWKVSKAAILYRAKQLSMITDEQYTTGVIRLKRGGEARGEAEDGRMEFEPPELFGRAVSLFGKDLASSVRTVADALEVLPSVVQEFLPGPLTPVPDNSADSFCGDNVIAVDFRRAVASRRESVIG